MASAAHAGPLLDEALARHRTLAASQAVLAPISLDGDSPDAVVSAVGGPGRDLPSLLLSPLRGDGGLRIRAHTALADGTVQARLGAAWQAGDPHPYSLDGSALSIEAGAGSAYASVERRHWGPSWVGSLILDGGARPLPAIGWRNDDAAAFDLPVLRWLGSWNTDLFAGQLSEPSGPQHAHLIGGRFQFMPLQGLELAVSRTIQWGGSGRPQSARSFYDALVGNDNVGTSLSLHDEPGNQLAGFDARYSLHFDAARSASVYAQAIGEDEAGHLPSHYLGSIGADTVFAFRQASLRAFMEHADTTVRGAFGTPELGVAYRHHIYTAGYTQLGDPLGFPAGGDVVLNSAGALVDAGRWSGVVMLHRGNAYPTAQLYPGGGRLSGANVELSWQATEASRIGASLMRWADPLASRTRGQLWWQFALR